jgi:calcineurin-like phosphoesterase
MAGVSTKHADSSILGFGVTIELFFLFETGIKYLTLGGHFFKKIGNFYLLF